MNGKLHSLTDVLKKTLFFFDALTVEEIIPHVHRQMLKDLSVKEVGERVVLCLRQNPCFELDGGGNLWRLNLEGKRENDYFYSMLLKRQQPLSLKEVVKNQAGKKKKKKIITEEAALISDGRFVQLNNGYWGLTEWEVENGHYSLKELIIRALKMHPAGLSLQQLHDVVSAWRPVNSKALEEILNKFPYFEMIGDGIWCYNQASRTIYEDILRRYLGFLNRQRVRWHKNRERWKQKLDAMRRQLEEVTTAHREAAAALARRLQDENYYENLMTQMAEKDLLLSLRKKEIYRYREHVQKLEAKANSILHQCRLWVKRAREAEAENARLKDVLAKNQSSLESLFTKLQQYKERDRENKARLADLKERQAGRIAELQTEIIELKQRLEKEREMKEKEEERLREEINVLSSDLRSALENYENLQRTLKFAQREAERYREECRRLEEFLNNPLVKLIVKLCSFFSRQPQKVL